MSLISWAVQAEEFDMAHEHAALMARVDGCGAVAFFLGVVRGGEGLTALALEHYPGMTEQSVQDIAAQTEARFDLLGGRIIHRYGVLPVGAAIVIVLMAAPHRQVALEAVGFAIDHLKTAAVFWKQELFQDRPARWVEARAEDDSRSAGWG